VLVVGAAGAAGADCPFGADGWVADGDDEAGAAAGADVAL
jgi:hypothetical protein